MCDYIQLLRVTHTSCPLRPCKPWRMPMELHCHARDRGFESRQLAQAVAESGKARELCFIKPLSPWPYRVNAAWDYIWCKGWFKSGPAKADISRFSLSPA